MRVIPMDAADTTPNDWSLESLDKAYQKGYMSGLTGQTKLDHGLHADVLIAAWEAGWNDGHEQYLRHQHLHR